MAPRLRLSRQPGDEHAQLGAREVAPVVDIDHREVPRSGSTPATVER
jgi:hypothetical protein